MGKHTKRNWVLGLGAIILIGAVVYYNPELLQGNVNDGITDLGDGTVDNQQDIQTFSGTLTQTTQAYDTESSTVTYGDDTETNVAFYKCISGSCNAQSDFVFLSASSNADPAVASLPITADIKTVYMETSILTGQGFYVDADETNAVNARVGNPLWLDLDKNNRNTYVFPVDVTGYKADPNTNPTQTVQLAIIKEGNTDVDSPPDIVALSQGKVRCNIKWSADIDVSGRGEIVTRVRITANQTDTGMWYPLDSNISWPNGFSPTSGTHKIYLNEFTSTQLASSTQYDYKIGNGDLNTGQALISPLNGETNFEIPVEIFTNFISNDQGIQWTLELQTINAQGATTLNSDVVKCLET